MEPGGSLPHSQEPVTCPYPVPESNPVNAAANLPPPV